MTEQIPNDQFLASSFLQGHNAEYPEQLYARFTNNPASDKIEAMRMAGITVAESPACLGAAELKSIG